MLSSMRKTKGGAQSVHRAIGLLREVANNNDQGIRLSKVAAKVGLHVATARRVLFALAEEGIVFFDPLTKHYRLGYELYSLGLVAHQYALKEKLYSVLEQLALDTGDSVFLFIPSGLDVLCINCVQGSYPIRASTVKNGDRRPFGIGAASLSILACLPDGAANSIISANASRYAEFGNQTVDGVKQLVSLAKKLGYSLYDRQAGVEFTAVGVPIQDQQNRVVAAISVSAIHVRMSRERQIEIVKNVRMKIAAVGSII